MKKASYQEFNNMIDDYIERGKLNYKKEDILHDMTNNFVIANDDGFLIYGFNRGECWIHHAYSKMGHDLNNSIYETFMNHVKFMECKKVYLITPYAKAVMRKWKGFKDTGERLLEMEVT